jgi:hypothetical protein
MATKKMQATKAAVTESEQQARVAEINCLLAQRYEAALADYGDKPMLEGADEETVRLLVERYNRILEFSVRYRASRHDLFAVPVQQAPVQVPQKSWREWNYPKRDVVAAFAAGVRAMSEKLVYAKDQLAKAERTIDRMAAGGPVPPFSRWGF